MSEAGNPGPELNDQENLYRCITTKAWWSAAENRPSSAAFKQPTFSADIASVAGSPQYTHSRFPPECGIVRFNCGDARVIGFTSRKETDPDFPENLAHAHVYNDQGTSKRKTMAQDLIQKIVETNGIEIPPTFE